MCLQVRKPDAALAAANAALALIGGDNGFGEIRSEQQAI